MQENVRTAYDSFRNFEQKAFRSACYAPFVSLFLTTDGKVLACCKNGSYILGNVQQDRLKDIWTGKKIQKLREALQDYTFHLDCSYCDWEITGGNFKTATPLLFDELPVLSPVPEWPAMIEFEGSNTCNFECIMCNGNVSSSIRTHRDGLPPMRRAYTDEFFQDLRQFLPHLKRMRFFGGEPFLAPESYRVWEMMMEDGLSTECHVTTNGSQFNSQMEQIMETLPFYIVVSMDGATKETVEKIRMNCRYEQLIENIHRFHDYTKHRGTAFHLAFCLMRQNWKEFADLLLFAEDQGIEVWVNTVIDPSRCSLYTLPRNELRHVVAQLEKQNGLASQLHLNARAWEEALIKLRGVMEGGQSTNVAKVIDRYFVSDDPWQRTIDLAAAGHYQEALEMARNVPEDEASYYSILDLCGYCRGMLGDLEGAEQELLRAFRMSQKKPDAYVNLARIRLKQNRLEDAFENATRAAKLALEEERIQFEAAEVLAFACVRKGKILKAARALKPITNLQAKGDDAEALARRVYHTSGLRPQLLKEVNSQPESPKAKITLLVLCLLLHITIIAAQIKSGKTSLSKKLRTATSLFRRNFHKSMSHAFHDFQLARLTTERILARFLHPDDFRIMATACWSFPIYSQTFVYQELTQLIKKGYRLRFIYSKQDSRKHLPAQFDDLWHARRRLNLHWTVCRRDYEYFFNKMPEKVNSLIDMVCSAAGLPQEKLKEHHHFWEAFSFARMVQAYRPDYLHSYFFYEGTLFALFASYLLDIPRGVSCYADHMLNDYEWKVLPLHLRQSKLIVATSQQIKEELMSLAPDTNPNRILVKPNAINADQFPMPIRKNPQPGKPFRIVSVSRIEPKKGLIYLVEAIGQLREQDLNVELHIIGAPDDTFASKEYVRQLQCRIEELNLSEIVHLEGFQPETQINEFFRKSHVFVAPFVQTESGDKDGIPTSLLEAMASGLPIVATDAGSIPEVIESGRDGLLVAQRDSTALANALLELIRDQKRREELGQNAAHKIREKFDVTVCEQRFHNRLTEMLSLQRTQPSIKPLVSVVTIFFNAEGFIRESIDSVLAQNYENWEYYLVDDGSTDHSAEIVKEYVAKYPEKIHYLDHPGHLNQGMSASRNLGVRHSKGEYIAFLDADDVWFPNKLSEQARILAAHPEASMLLGASLYWHSWTGKPEDLGRDRIPDQGVDVDRLYQPEELSLLNYPLGTGTAPCPSDLMIKRKSLMEVGGFEEHFRGKYQLYEDQGFLAKMYLHYPVFVTHECLDQYRIHSESCLAVVKGAGQYDSVRLYFLNWFERYLSERNRRGSQVWDALQTAFAPYRTRNDEPEKVERSQKTPDVQWGHLRRLSPISLTWGFDRGTPIDRYYIESFLRNCASDIYGHVLEIEEDRYTTRFGGDRVKKLDVLHVVEGTPQATIVTDLTRADHLPSDLFDCEIVTQTLHYIYDFRAALKTLHRILKPGGVLLATVPGITRTNFWFWSFTAESMKRLFQEFFRPENIQVQVFGNVLAASAFLYGLAAQELEQQELDHLDPEFEIVIAVRAYKK